MKYSTVNTALNAQRSNGVMLGVLVLAAIFLTACGGGGGGGQDVTVVETEQPPDTSSRGFNYTGPAAATDDVRNFQNTLWRDVTGADPDRDYRCGDCHGEGGQSPTFASRDDVNAAYSIVVNNNLADLAQPARSRLVTKFSEGDGHICWLGNSNQGNCADQLAASIAAWAGVDSGVTAAAGISITEADLANKVFSDPNADFIAFPEDTTDFRNTVWPLLATYCADCHTDTAAIPQSPFLAHADVATAYEAAKSKIDLNTPSISRIVVRVGEEFHNCWSDCNSNAAELLAAVEDFAIAADDGVTGEGLDPDALKFSKAFTIPDGFEVEGGGRHDGNVIAKYEFNSGEGNVIRDTSLAAPQLDLELFGDEGIDYKWVGGWGIEFLTEDARAMGDPENSRKIFDMIRLSGEYSIEAWLVPASAAQASEDDPARIVSYSGSDDLRNFSLAQSDQYYNFRNRTTLTDGNGEPTLVNEDDTVVNTQQHVVVTYDPVNGRRIYVNGELTPDLDPAPGGALSDWDNSYALVLGNEVDGKSPWQGRIRFLALHNRVLTESQIRDNLTAGVGQRFHLLFDVSQYLDGVEHGYVVFEVSQFDDYAYLFDRPTFILLAEGASADDIPAAGIAIEGMRIGINGKEAEVGQAYAPMSVTVTQNEYSTNGYPLSAVGTIIALQTGSVTDEFFLTFDNINGNESVIVRAVETQPIATVTSVGTTDDIGLRNFAEINATMATVTGVSTTQTDVATTFTTLRQQLPTSESIGGFLSAHQTGIAQLAIEYCNALVEDEGLRGGYFPGLDFGVNANDISSGDWNALVIDPMIDRMMGVNLTNQPDVTLVRDELNVLLTDGNDIKPIGAPDGIPDGLARCGGDCEVGRTETVVKAACAALLGSAVMLVQ